MFPLEFRILPWAGFCVAACAFSTLDIRGAEVVAGPGDAGLRGAIASAQDGDTVILTNRVELQSSIRIDKRLTFRFRGDPWYGTVSGSFTGALFRVAADGVVLESLRLYGSAQTDGLLVEEDVILRDCLFEGFREPVVDDFWPIPSPTVRLERVTVTRNPNGLGCSNLEAKDCTFSFNGGYAACGAYTAKVEGCRFENNAGAGLLLGYGTVKNCIFRFNAGIGLHCDPDPGVLNVSGSLFYANGGGGILLGEQLVATVDNCTFTRHTGAPAIMVFQATYALFRHCTVADNVFISSVEPGAWPPELYGGAFAIIQSRSELQNCLVADNPTDASPHASGLVGDWIDGGENVIGGPAKLGTLRNNGGQTLSLLPQPGSPAIDAGRPSDLVLDARGLSRQAGAAPDAGAIETDAQPLADTDGDGLPDIWELLHVLDPSNPVDAASDGDADGQNALAEFRGRTDPGDPQSVVRCVGFLIDPFPMLQSDLRFVSLTWSVSPGVTYELETSADLRQWRQAPIWFHGASIHEGRQTLFYMSQTETPVAFYRLAVKNSVFD